MNKNKLLVGGLAVAMLAAQPVSYAAAPAAGSPYYTDITNQYVDDLTSNVIGSLNGVLCHLQAVRPDAMVNLGAYYALVDENVCNGGGGNHGAQYAKAVANSTQTSGTAPMLADMWFDAGNGGTIKALAHLSATQAPSATVPYGVFRADYCDNSNPAACGAMFKGYIDAAATGVTHWSSDSFTMGAVTFTSNTGLSLVLSSATAGSGGMNLTQSATGGAATTSAYSFAFDPNLFIRNDGVASQCFDRTLANATLVSWDYGLYDSTTGARYDRNSGFPIQYTDAAGVTQQGYIGYWGLWVSALTLPPSGTTLTKIDYSTNPPTNTNYTLLQSGGKLIKHTKTVKTLAAMHKVHFSYWANANIPAVTPIMTMGTTYDLYWDASVGVNKFMVAGTMDMMGNIIPYATPVAVANADMVAANSWGMWIWLPTNDQVTISAADMATLGTKLSNTLVAVSSQNIVYPDQYAKLGGMTCISDCPTAAAITAAGTALSTSSPYGLTTSGNLVVALTGAATTAGSPTVTVASTAGLVPGMQIADNTGLNTYIPFGTTIAAVVNATSLTLSANAAAATPVGGVALTASTWGLGTWGPRVPTANLTAYTLDANTGNLVDAALKSVASATVPTNGNPNFWGYVWSGKMVAATNNGQSDSKPELDLAKGATNVGLYSQADVDLLNSYYEWDTSPYSWDQLSVLKDAAGVFVQFDPMLWVNYAVPNTAANGLYAGSTASLTYGGFGQLWGIPWLCTDLQTNTPCNFAALAPGAMYPANWVWAPAYSIPFDPVTGVVTADAAAATKVVGATGTVTYAVKPLDVSVYLKNVPLSTCTTAGLNIPATFATPTMGGFKDPSAVMGAMPTPANTAPRVIQGVVKY